MTMDGGHLGAIGEAALEQWCHEVNITPNRVRYDAKGWDFFLQFPGGPAEVACLVQVKATTSTRGRVGVKTKNWFHLCCTPLPSFFLVVIIDHAMKPSRAYLVHVDEEAAAKIVKRKRSKTIDLTWSEDDALSSLSGAALKAARVRLVVAEARRRASRAASSPSCRP